VTRPAVGRPRKTADDKMIHVSITVKPSHLKWAVEKADELSKATGQDVSFSAVIRGCIRHTHDTPPKEWRTE